MLNDKINGNIKEIENNNSNAELPKKLTEILNKNKNKYNLELIKQAFDMAKQAHQNQKRYSGEPYIIHSIETATTLADMGADTETICAGLLHDVPEDTKTTLEEIEKQFGKDVAFLVDGVTKLGKIRYPKKSEDDAMNAQNLHIENLRKMFFATAKDIRVILIRLADRLHNMKTLQYVPEEKQMRIALETLEVYAPVAHRLGIGQIRGELEDLAFPIVEPEEYAKLKRNLAKVLTMRKKELKKFQSTVQNKLNHDKVKIIEIHGRVKHLWSLWKKISKPEYAGDLDKIYDLTAIRVIVPTIADIYSVLGSIHQLYKPLPGRIKDYIATPKPNGYRSLHSTVFGPNGRPIEIQIRTEQMHQDAEFGIAAQWIYNETGKPDEGAALKSIHLTWLKQLEEWQKKIKGPEDFWENLKIDFFHNRIFVLTPKGDVFDLPDGSTPIDFAYSVHSALGHKMIGAQINNKIASLTSPIKNGDIVEIITSKKTNGPKRDWINFAKTTIAKHSIRQWFSAQSKTHHILMGKKLLDQELLSDKLMPFDKISSNKKKILIDKFHCRDLNDLFINIGRTDINPRTVVKALFPEKYQIELPKKKNTIRALPKKEEFLIHKAHCCLPKEGDQMLGYISSVGRGIIAHKENCKNIKQQKNNLRLIPLGWRESEIKITSPKTINIFCSDRIGLLHDVTSMLVAEKINLKTVKLTKTKDYSAVITLTLELTGLNELQHIIDLIRQVPNVVDVKRK